MRVTIQRADDVSGFTFATLDMERVPNVGEIISFAGIAGLSETGMWVQNVHHHIERLGNVLVASVTVVVSPRSESPLSIYLDWENTADRPDWIADSCVISCDSVPLQGDFIELSFLSQADIDRAHEATEGEIELPVAVLCEVVAVVHSSVTEPSDFDDGQLFFLPEMETGIIVRRSLQTEIKVARRVIAARRERLS